MRPWEEKIQDVENHVFLGSQPPNSRKTKQAFQKQVDTSLIQNLTFLTFGQYIKWFKKV